MNKILVTGRAGFIGPNFIYYCLNNDNIVLNYDGLSYAGNINNLEKNINKSSVYDALCLKQLIS